MANIKNRKKLQLIQTIWDVMLCSQHFTFHWKLLVLVSRIEKSGTGDNNFGKWNRPKWPDRSQWTTFKAGPEYSGRTKPKWSVPFDVPTEITGILGSMESAPCFSLFTCLSSLVVRRSMPASHMPCWLAGSHIRPIYIVYTQIYTFKDVDCKKEQERSHVSHHGNCFYNALTD